MLHDGTMALSQLKVSWLSAMEILIHSKSISALVVTFYFIHRGPLYKKRINILTFIKLQFLAHLKNREITFIGPVPHPRYIIFDIHIKYTNVIRIKYNNVIRIT